MNSSVMEKPKISIGMPVYDGEKFIRKSLDSVLAQTFIDFELIISDNASTDSTSLICQEYAKRDKRIRYIRQEKNIGPAKNFKFVLQEARSEYFWWAAVDDYILPDFIKKNLKVLESNKNFVGSISRSQTYRKDIPNLEYDPIDLAFGNFRHRVISVFRPSAAYAMSGTYEQKVRTLFKKSAYQVMYSVFRTDKLRASMTGESFVGFDVPLVLNILKHGDINMLDEVLMYRYERGISTQGSLDISRMYNPSLFGMIFPHYPVTFWCAKHLGTKIFLKNLDHFIELNLGSEFFLIVDLIRLFIQKIIRNQRMKKYNIF